MNGENRLSPKSSRPESGASRYDQVKGYRRKMKENQKD